MSLNLDFFEAMAALKDGATVITGYGELCFKLTKIGKYYRLQKCNPITGAEMYNAQLEPLCHDGKVAINTLFNWRFSILKGGKHEQGC